MMSRDLFAREALRWIPKILTLQDRNRHSPTYGCFDRNYWQYKIIDFPSGMSQEFVYPLALVWAADLPGNPFFQQPAIRDWAEAGMVFAARSAHADASCDDYFPFEKAGGAAAFSLLACAESYRILGLQNYEVLQFFERRADWLAHHHESGQLTNHQALIVRCLDRVGALLGKEDKWAKARAERLARVLAWQNEEGWFQEYEGCDPGYHTLTVSLLAEIYETTPTPELRAALEKAVALAAEFVHPDGSFAGEYASRNTYNFFPHGFELFGRHCTAALAINDRFLAGLAAGRAPCYADDHIVGHHTWNYLLAWRDWVNDRPTPAPRPTGRVHFKNAGLLIDRVGDAELYVALNKGGTFKLFRDGQLVASDTQVSLVLEDGKRRNAVAHLVANYPSEVDEGRVSVSGDMGWAKQKKMTPFNLIVLRMIMLGGGKFFPNLVRKLLQRLLITGKKAAPFRFHREFVWNGDRLTVNDRVEATAGGDWKAVRQAAIGCDQTSIYVVMSRTYQAGQMLPWLDLTEQVTRLQPGEPLEVQRQW